MHISGACHSLSAYFHSPQPQQAGEAAHTNTDPTAEETKTSNTTEANSNKETNASQNDKQNQQLSQDEQKEVQQLQDRDREVRAHEAAHKAAAGQLAKGGASFSFQRGADGKLYAVGGEVSIDTSKVSDDPQATLQKANQIRAAALAPAQPSAQDHAVAADAAMMAAEARKEIAAEHRGEPKTNPTSQHSETSEAAEKPQQARPSHSAETRHYQAVANGSSAAEPAKLDLMA